ncbi:MAG: TIGR04282 family arsenosugar biosynthesis glycosyltransferase [Clostridiales bacterium]|jgi:rSAM/selenodomain-associated transferase 1|nr:TIGR04282 family arsenosugar biosynthesis glycosyltransferase [Clostridiales bacterium]
MKLLVFTRYPEPGKVKTRLVSALGNEEASRLHQEMTEHTVNTLSSAGAELEIWFDGGDEKRMRAWLGENLQYKHQDQGDLGEKLQGAFADAFHRHKGCVAAVGCDCPDLTAGHIQDAFSRLSECDVVLGPAVDGGYYLIGMRTLQASLFNNIDWGSEHVLQQTLSIAKKLGLKVGLLEKLTDVDRPEDLFAWIRRKNKY